MNESVRYSLQILVFIALILLIGTVGYLMIEDGLTLNDAFYLAVTAITPTQFEKVHEMSVPGRYFTVGLVFCGFGAFIAFATQFARLMIQSELEGVGVFTRKQMRRRMIKQCPRQVLGGQLRYLKPPALTRLGFQLMGEQYSLLRSMFDPVRKSSVDSIDCNTG